MNNTRSFRSSRHDLEGSWRRCRKMHAIDEHERRPASILTADELAVVRAPVEPILAEAQEELGRLYACVRDVGYSTLVAEPGGAIVYRQCRDADEKEFDHYGSRPGAIWSEQQEGTNGIGTCIVEARPLNVHRREHYRRRHKQLSCSGAPILDPSGRLDAVINVCSFATEFSDRSHRLALSLVSQVAREIEERRFRSRYRDCWILLLQGVNDAASTRLIAVDRWYRVVDADLHARQALGLQQTDLEQGVEVWSIFEKTISGMGRPGQGDRAISLTRVECDEVWHGLISPPGSTSPASRAVPYGCFTRPRRVLLSSLAFVADSTGSRGGLSPAALSRVRRYIESHIHEKIDIVSLAEAAGLSRYHFSRAFKLSVGVAPYQYVMQHRVENAARLIERSDWPLSYIATATGFSDQSHFARVFARLMGVPPGNYRRNKSAD